MALHQILIHKAGPNRIPSLALAPLADGDSITFTADDSADSLLCFSPDTLAVLSPKPETNHVELAGGASVTFQLAGLQPINYVVVLQAAGWPVPASIDSGEPSGKSLLVIKKADGADFPDPADSGSGKRGV